MDGHIVFCWLNKVWWVLGWGSHCRHHHFGKLDVKGLSLTLTEQLIKSGGWES